MMYVDWSPGGSTVAATDQHAAFGGSSHFTLPSFYLDEDTALVQPQSRTVLTDMCVAHKPRHDLDAAARPCHGCIGS